MYVHCNLATLHHIGEIVDIHRGRYRIWKRAPPKPAGPDGYAEKGGVKFGPVRLLAGAPSGVKGG